nr:MAG TPA: hypothetical protein [Caudoviricetes sp.]
MRDKAPLKTLAWLLAYSTYDYTMVRSYHEICHRLLVATAVPRRLTLARDGSMDALFTRRRFQWVA